MSHNLESAVITHIGSVKDSNEDNYYINGKYKSDSNVHTDGVADKKTRPSYVFAVCDGMGGESYGELASLIAAATLEKFQKTEIRETIDNYVKTANDFIYDLIMKNKSKMSGSTLALLSIKGNSAVSYNIGDSNVYLWRRGDLYLLSCSHFDEETKKLTQYLGIPPGDAPPEIFESEEVKIKKGDIFMLCTAGLLETVAEDEIVELLAGENETAINLTKKLVAVSQERKCKSDVTAIIAKVI